MEKIIIKIAKGDQNYGAWIDDIPGIYGQGDTVEEAKKELQEGLLIYIKHNKNIPEILKENSIFEYRFDLPSFLEYYSKVFSKPALESITGINQKQLFHYSSGLRKPTEKTVKKMDNAIRHFANELSQVRFL